MSADVLALFDLDHTLVPRDSDEQWVEFLIDEGRIDAERFEVANRDLNARFNRGEADTIEFAEFYLSTLTAFDDDTLRALRERFLEQRIRPRILPAARELVLRHRAAGHLCVITTAVIRFLSQPIAAEFGVDHVIATEGERVDGRWTGRVAGATNTREGKVERLHQWLAARGEWLRDFREVWAYCDSVNDLPLMSIVTRPVAVNADPVLAAHARHQGWSVATFA